MVLIAAHTRSDDRPRLDKRTAVESALRNVEVTRAIAGEGYTRTRVLRLDDELTRVTFFDGPRVIVEAAVDPRGEVWDLQPIGRGYVRAGSHSVQSPAVLALLSVIFALATVSLPLRSIRNVDVLAFLGVVAGLYLLNERLFELSTILTLVPLLYLACRCLRRGLYVLPTTPFRARDTLLLDALLNRVDPATAGRLSKLVLAGLAAAFAIAAIPGGQVGDVGFASLAGATALLDGNLPYGNVGGGIVHGDTYPLLCYIVYLPGALVSPVRDVFDNAESALWIATTAAFIAAFALGRSATRIGGSELGVGQAIAWLAFPPVLITASSGSNDMVAAALVACATVAFGRATLSSGLLAAAAWVKVVPVLALPAWIAASRERGKRGPVLAVALVSAPIVVLLLAYGGPAGIVDMLEAIAWQAGRGTNLSVWTYLDSPPLQALFQALVVTLTFVVALAVWQRPQLAANPLRVFALAGGVMLLAQLAGNYWSYAYFVWVYPLIAAALLWPVGGRQEEDPA